MAYKYKINKYLSRLTRVLSPKRKYAPINYMWIKEVLYVPKQVPDITVT